MKLLCEIGSGMLQIRQLIKDIFAALTLYWMIKSAKINSASYVPPLEISVLVEFLTSAIFKYQLIFVFNSLSYTTRGLVLVIRSVAGGSK